MPSRRSDQPPAPPVRGATDRDALRAALREGSWSARELSGRVGLPEKAVGAHLEHVAKSARARHERFFVEPARCASCGFRFETRARLSRPSRCPSCGGERIEAPRFGLEPE